MKIYKTIWLTTVDSYHEVAELKAKGWTVTRESGQSVQLVKETNNETKRT